MPQKKKIGTCMHQTVHVHGPRFNAPSFYHLLWCTRHYPYFNSVPFSALIDVKKEFGKIMFSNFTPYPTLVKITSHWASWLIGKSGASHAADPSSIPGEGDEMAKKIDRFLTFVYFCYGCAWCVNDCGDDIESLFLGFSKEDLLVFL